MPTLEELIAKGFRKPDLDPIAFGRMMATNPEEVAKLLDSQGMKPPPKGQGLTREMIMGTGRDSINRMVDDAGSRIRASMPSMPNLPTPQGATPVTVPGSKVINGMVDALMGKVGGMLPSAPQPYTGMSPSMNYNVGRRGAEPPVAVPPGPQAESPPAPSLPLAFNYNVGKRGAQDGAGPVPPPPAQPTMPQAPQPISAPQASMGVEGTPMDTYYGSPGGAQQPPSPQPPSPMPDPNAGVTDVPPEATAGSSWGDIWSKLGSVFSAPQGPNPVPNMLDWMKPAPQGAQSFDEAGFVPPGQSPTAAPQQSGAQSFDEAGFLPQPGKPLDLSPPNPGAGGKPTEASSANKSPGADEGAGMRVQRALENGLKAMAGIAGVKPPEPFIPRIGSGPAPYHPSAMPNASSIMALVQAMTGQKGGASDPNRIRLGTSLGGRG